MRAWSIGVVLAGTAIALPMAARAQLKPQLQTGSLIPVNPQAVDPERAGAIRKSFAQCVYSSARLKVTALLSNSDPETVDLAAAKIKKVADDLNMDYCLGKQVGYDQSALGMRLSPRFLRDLLAEEAYLASNRTVPVLPSPPAPIPELKTRYVSTGPLLAVAQGMVNFTDCAIFKDIAHADALLRTMPGSKAERAAAQALGSTLGRCLQEGQNVRLNATSIRALMAFAMWNRFGRGAGQ